MSLSCKEIEDHKTTSVILSNSGSKSAPWEKGIRDNGSMILASYAVNLGIREFNHRVDSVIES